LACSMAGRTASPGWLFDLIGIPQCCPVTQGYGRLSEDKGMMANLRWAVTRGLPSEDVRVQIIGLLNESVKYKSDRSPGSVQELLSPTSSAASNLRYETRLQLTGRKVSMAYSRPDEMRDRRLSIYYILNSDPNDPNDPDNYPNNDRDDRELPSARGRPYTEEEGFFIWYQYVDKRMEWDAVRALFINQFPGSRTKPGLQGVYYRLKKVRGAGKLPRRPEYGAFRHMNANQRLTYRWLDARHS